MRASQGVWKKRLFFFGWVVFSTLVLLEFACRLILVPYFNWKSQQRANLNLKFNIGSYDLIALGDSVVQSGKIGWTPMLKKKGWTVLNLGIGGACPEHYLQRFQRIKPLLHDKQKVIIVLNLSNDFLDEAIWESIQDKDSYFAVRDSRYFDTKEFYFPYARTSDDPLQKIRNHSYLLKAVNVMMPGVQLSLASGPLDKYVGIIALKDLSAQDKLLAELLQEEISNPDWVFRKGGENFFLKHHNVAAWQANGKNQAAGERILQMARELKSHRNVFLVPVLSREEIGASLHQQPVLKHSSFIDRLQKVNSNVIDPNPAFFQEFEMGKKLYLPDGHWNSQGHQLFADCLETLLNKHDKNPEMVLN